MVFYGFLIVVGLGLLGLVIRSPVVRQVRRGHGFDGSTVNGLVDHHLDRYSYKNPTWNDDGRGGTRESTRVSKQLGVRGRNG